MYVVAAEKLTKTACSNLYYCPTSIVIAITNLRGMPRRLFSHVIHNKSVIPDKQ